MIMNTPTTPDGAPVAPEQSPVQAPGALKAITTKIVTALAAIGIATAVTENADGALVILGT
jgi:hypothetical protein